MRFLWYPGKKVFYRTVKNDPGEAFMREVRERVPDLHLAGPPVMPGDTAR